MRLPQSRRLRVERPARAIGERLQRPMLQPARPLDAAARGEPIGNDDPAESRTQSDDERGAETENDHGVEETQQIREDNEEAEHEKHAEHSQPPPTNPTHALTRSYADRDSAPR